MSRVTLPAPLTETMWVEVEGGFEQVGYTASQMESYAAYRVREALDAVSTKARNRSVARSLMLDDIERIVQGLMPPTPGEPT